MLQPTLPETAQQEQFAQLYAQYQGDWPSFWTAVDQAFGTPTAAKLQLAGQLYYLTLNNEPLVTALKAAEAKQPAHLHLGPRHPRLLRPGQVGAADRRVDPAGDPRCERGRAGQQLRATAGRPGAGRLSHRGAGRPGPARHPAGRRDTADVAEASPAS